jgi:hypothetical protein
LDSWAGQVAQSKVGTVDHFSVGSNMLNTVAVRRVRLMSSECRYIEVVAIDASGALRQRFRTWSGSS